MILSPLRNCISCFRYIYHSTHEYYHTDIDIKPQHIDIHSVISNTYSTVFRSASFEFYRQFSLVKLSYRSINYHLTYTLMTRFNAADVYLSSLFFRENSSRLDENLQSVKRKEGGRKREDKDRSRSRVDFNVERESIAVNVRPGCVISIDIAAIEENRRKKTPRALVCFFERISGSWFDRWDASLLQPPLSSFE